MIENLLIIGGAVIGIVICIGIMVAAFKNYIIFKKAYQKKEKPRRKAR